LNPFRKTLIGVGLTGSALLGGGVGAALINSSATAQSTTTAPSGTSQAPTAPSDQRPANFDPARGGHVGSNGTREELLTGDAADKVRAAALAAVPGGTSNESRPTPRARPTRRT
jgi:hypothetical protein